MGKEYEVGIEAKERLREFEKELIELIIKHDIESYSKVSGHILAKYMMSRLIVLNSTIAT